MVKVCYITSQNKSEILPQIALKCLVNIHIWGDIQNFAYMLHGVKVLVRSCSVLSFAPGLSFLLRPKDFNSKVDKECKYKHKYLMNGSHR